MMVGQVVGTKGFVLLLAKGNQNFLKPAYQRKSIDQLGIVCGVCKVLSHANLGRNIVLNLAGLNTYAIKVFGVIKCVALSLSASVVVRYCTMLGLVV
jgi:hypothetical protein